MKLPGEGTGVGSLWLQCRMGREMQGVIHKVMSYHGEGRCCLVHVERCPNAWLLFNLIRRCGSNAITAGNDHPGHTGQIPGIVLKSECLPVFLLVQP